MSLLPQFSFDHLFGQNPIAEPEVGADPFGRIGAGNPDWESARGRWMDGGSLRDLFGEGMFRLNDTVGTGRSNQRGDAFKLQALLHREGALDAKATGGPTGYWGNRDDAALRSYQNDNGLTVDGWVAPDGPTMKSLRKGYEQPMQYAQAAPTVMSDAVPQPSERPAAPADVWWESPIHADFRNSLYERESRGGTAGGYDADNDGAYGRYQMRVPALKDAGLLDEQGNWTGKYGVRSFEDFKRNPKAQEQAFADFMRRTEDYVEAAGLKKYLDRDLDGRMERFKISESGLAAAAHRQGAGMVKAYFDFKEHTNWQKSDFKTIPEADEKAVAALQSKLKPEQRQSAATAFASVETRLREFSRIPYRRHTGN